MTFDFTARRRQHSTPIDRFSTYLEIRSPPRLVAPHLVVQTAYLDPTRGLLDTNERGTSVNLGPTPHFVVAPLAGSQPKPLHLVGTSMGG